MRSPSAAAMLTMVAAATIVRFPPVRVLPVQIINQVREFLDGARRELVDIMEVIWHPFLQYRRHNVLVISKTGHIGCTVMTSTQTG